MPGKYHRNEKYNLLSNKKNTWYSLKGIYYMTKSSDGFSIVLDKLPVNIKMDITEAKSS